MKRRIIATLLAVLLIINLAACSHADSSAATEGDSISAGTRNDDYSGEDILVMHDYNEWVGTDPFQSGSWNDTQSLIADSILAIDQATKAPVPDIASKSVWSDDGLTWTLTFPEGMYYSTGEQLEPEDFIASLEYGREVGTRSESYKSIESMEVNGRDVIIHLSNFQADMEFNFENYFIGVIDKDEIESMTKEEMLWGCHPYGAYYVDKYEPGAYVIIKANPYYRTNNPMMKNKGVCPVKTIKVVFVGEDFTIATGIQSGEYDFISNIPMEYYDELVASSEVDVVPQGVATIAYAEMNMKDPILSDINVRKAIIKGFSRENLSKYVTASQTPAYCFVGPKCLNYSIDAVNYYKSKYDYNVSEARLLLESAGWADSDGDGILDKNGTPLSFTFTIRDSEPVKVIAQSIQNDMKALGIDMQIVAKQNAYVRQDVIDGNFQMGYLSIGWGDPFKLMDLIAQRNPECTNPDPQKQLELVAEARRNTNAAKRAVQITELQERIMDYCTVIPLADFTGYRAWRSEIKGILCAEDGVLYFNDIVTDSNGNFRNVQ